MAPTTITTFLLLQLPLLLFFLLYLTSSSATYFVLAAKKDKAPFGDNELIEVINQNLDNDQRAELLRLVTAIFTEVDQQLIDHTDLYLDVLFSVFRDEFESALANSNFGKGNPFLVLMSDFGLLPESVLPKKKRRGVTNRFLELSRSWTKYLVAHRSVPYTFNPEQMVTVEPDLFRIFFEDKTEVSYGEVKEIFLSYADSYPLNEKFRKRDFFGKSAYAKVRTCRMEVAFILLVIQPFLRQVAAEGGGRRFPQPNPQLHSLRQNLPPFSPQQSCPSFSPLQSPATQTVAQAQDEPVYNLVNDNDCYSTLLPDRHGGTKRQYWLVDDTSFHSFLLSDLPADPTGPQWPTVPEPVRYWLLPVEKKHLAEIPGRRHWLIDDQDFIAFPSEWVEEVGSEGHGSPGQPSPQHPIPPSPPPPQPPYSPAPVPGNAGAFVEMPLPQPPGYLIPVENLYWMNRDEIATRGNIPSVMVLEGGMEPYYGRIPDRSETAHITDPNHYVIRKGVRKPGDNIEVAGMKYDMQVPRDELIPLPEELAQGAQDAMVEAALKLRREGGRGCSLNVAVPAELVPPQQAQQAQPSPPPAGGSPRGEKRGLDEEPPTCRIS